MIFPALLSFVAQRELTPAQEMGIVRAFATAARTGIDATIVLPPYAAEGEQPLRQTFLEHPNDPGGGLHVYQFSGATVYLNRKSGLVQAYSDPTSWSLNRRRTASRVDAAQATLLAQRFYAATGWGGNEIVVSRVENATTDNRADVEVIYSPAWRGVTYDYQNTMDLDRQTGQLTDLGKSFDWLPAPPVSPVPGGTSEQARLAGLAVATPWCGASLASTKPQPMELRLWYTRPEGHPRGRYTRPRDREAYSLGASHLAALRAGHAILAYQGNFWTPDGLTVTITVDARTGATLAVRQEDNIGSGGGASMSSLPVLSVPAVPRPWRVATGKKGWDAWTAPTSAALTPVAGTPSKGAKVTVTDGRAAFPATYDAKANLLSISGKTYRPGPALAALLKRRTKG